MLQAVREGLSPRVLSKIVRLPVRWRKNAEGLHDLYGSKLGLQEQAKFKDYQNAYRGLVESLEDLLTRLRNKKVEQESLGEEETFQLAGVSAEEARDTLAQSIQILEELNRRWQQMENPDQVRGGEVARTFQDLFQPLQANELKQEIGLLHQTFGDQAPEKAGGNGHQPAASVPAPAAELPTGEAPEGPIPGA